MAQKIKLFFNNKLTINIRNMKILMKSWTTGDMFIKIYNFVFKKEMK